MASPSASIVASRPDLALSVEQYDLQMQRMGYIANQVLPVFDTRKQSSAFGVIPLDQLLANANDSLVRAPGTGYARSSFTFRADSYATVEYGKEEPVDDREAELYADYFDAEVVATKRAVEAVLNAAERRVVSLITASVTQTSAASVAWSNKATAAPIDDFNTARNAVWAATGIWVNTLIISRNKFNQLRQCAQIIDAIKNNSNYQVLQGEINQQLLATALDVDRVIVSGTAKNTAKEGQTATIASTWTDTIGLVAKIATSNDLREPCLGRTFHWSQDGSQPLGQIESYRDDSVRSTIVRCRHDVHEKLIYPQAGYLLTGL